MTTNLITKAIEIIGLSKLAHQCSVSYQAVKKWEKNGCLPRTEWTGETNYASIIERFTNKEITSEQLLAKRVLPDLPPIPEDFAAVLPQLKNCGRLKDDRAIAQFLNLPPATRSEVFNTTPPNQLITEAICLKAKQALARGPQ